MKNSNLKKYFENMTVSSRMMVFTCILTAIFLFTGFSGFPQLGAISGIIILIVLSYLFTGSLKRPLKAFYESIIGLSEGKLNDDIPYHGLNNEFGRIGVALEALRQIDIKEAKKTWMKESVTEIAQSLQKCTTYADFGNELTSKIAPVMGIIYGAYYVSNEARTELKWVGGYACGDTAAMRSFAWGEGVIGQVACDKATRELSFSSGQVVSTHIGPGALFVSSVAVVPVVHRNSVIAVIELGTLGAFVEEQIVFLDTLLPLVALNMEILSGSIATQELLQKTQAQTQALAASEQQLLARKNELEESRAALEQIEERSRLILSSIKDGICGLDSSGIVAFANNAAGTMLGYAVEELLGKLMHTAVHYAHEDGTEYPWSECHIYRTTQDGKSRNITDEVLWRKDGTCFHVEYTTNPIYKNGVMVGIVVVFRDITERIRSEMAINKANFLADTALALSKAGYWHVPLDGSGWYNSSERAAAIFGDIPNPDLRYHIMDDWFLHVREGNEEAANAALKNFNDAVAGIIPVHDSVYAYKRPIDGIVVWIHSLGNVIRNAHGKPTDMYGVTQDITEFIRAQEEIRAAKEIAEEATKMKSDFLANMSHEIRTPMNAIIGMSHLALQTELTTKQRNYIEKVESAAKNLLGIINDILDFSKIEAGKMQFERHDFLLEDVLEHLADLSIIKAQEKGLELLFNIDTSVPTALVGDSLRLGQVLINLTNNAIKFTEKGEIIISVTKEADEPDGVRLYFGVADTGVGLSVEQQNKLFKAFSQADSSTTRKYGGTGLGLTISKRLVEMMDGQIAVKSEPGVGSTFYFTAKFGLQSAQRHLAATTEDAKGLHILVVDDNARAREIFKTMLTSLRFESTAVSSGTEAIAELERAALQNMPYGLVLMDWSMPGMDGVETIRRIRSDTRLANTPAFVMVTAYSRDELLQQTTDVKIDGLLVKPVSPSTLLDSILSALGKEVVHGTRKHKRQADYRLAEKSLSGAYVLLVEDNEVNQELALEILQEAGIRVDVAVNGLQSLEKVKAKKYDAVLMDCQMPVMDGFEATRSIRQDDSLKDLPVIAMTANAMAGDREKCIHSGMNDHIAKPIDVGQLFTTLAQWIKPKVDISVITQLSKTYEDGLPDIAGLDLKTAISRVGGKAGLLIKLITRFAETQSDVMSRIKTAIACNDFETATREAHTVKGLAGNIGANEMFDVAAAVEGMLHKGLTDELPQALESMELTLKGLLLRISSAVSSPVKESIEVSAGSTLTQIDMSAFTSEVKKFAALLADDDSSATDMVDGITEKLTACGAGAVAKQIKALISRFEFEDALEKLKEVSASIGVEL
ncbi:MAG: response regulator [Nitrospirae bacterium YQR-1]